MSTKNTDQTEQSTGLINKFKNSSFLKEFGEFINRGNVVDLAIGVAVGGAFTAIVKSLVDDIIMPITSLLAGGADFSRLAIDIPNIFGVDTTAHIAYGNFIQNVVNFLLVAFVIFLLVKLLNRLNRKKEADAKAIEAKEAEEAGKAQETEAKTKEQEESHKTKTKAKK